MPVEKNWHILSMVGTLCNIDFSFDQSFEVWSKCLMIIWVDFGIASWQLKMYLKATACMDPSKMGVHAAKYDSVCTSVVAVLLLKPHFQCIETLYNTSLRYLKSIGLHQSPKWVDSGWIAVEVVSERILMTGRLSFWAPQTLINFSFPFFLAPLLPQGFFWIG